MKKFLFILAIIILLAAPAFAESEETISLRIVPESIDDSGIRHIQSDRRFHVVITNISNQPVRLWKDTSSRGYGALSFAATDENGKKMIVEKSPLVWTNTLPVFVTIEPQDHLLIEVLLDPKIWQHADWLKLKKSQQLQMRAIFEIKNDEAAEEHKVWTGKAFSPLLTYILDR